MTWERFDSTFQRDTPYIRVMQDRISLSLKAYEFIHKPERVFIFYDIDKKAIKFEPNENGTKICAYRQQVLMSCRLSKVMPKGRYFMREGIFVK